METIAAKLFGQDAQIVLDGIQKLIEKYHNDNRRPWISQNDIVLITYGDSIKKNGAAPLRVLNDFLLNHVKNEISAVHILPCFPYTSDDGFSVVDYREINPDLGTWQDIENMASDFDIMLDAVINHASVKSVWFQKFLNCEDTYKDFFIVADPALDYSKVTRPRTLPLLTEFETAEGKKYVWTTFSADQADLNYKSPRLFLEILDVLGLYASKGARFIRLDAIGFMYKIIGTTCVHLEETHELIKLIRKFLDRVFPGTLVITETNVPHIDNISYFGNGDEAHMVYQFPLPPLTLYSFFTQSAEKLMDWINGLEATDGNTAFFNFLASHDGIGLRPTEGILTAAEQDFMVKKVLDRDGLVSYKDNGDGTKDPYELNINYMDALSNPEDNDEIRGQRLLAAHVILLSLAGVPGIYIHSLLGSGNDRQAAIESGINRRINRAKLDVEQLTAELATSRKMVFENMRKLLNVRKGQSAFSPEAEQKIVPLDKRVFSLWRINAKTGEKILALVNVSNDEVHLNTNIAGVDLIEGKEINCDVVLPPAGYKWILQS